MAFATQHILKLSRARAGYWQFHAVCCALLRRNNDPYKMMSRLSISSGTFAQEVLSIDCEIIPLFPQPARPLRDDTDLLGVPQADMNANIARTQIASSSSAIACAI